MCFFNSLRPSDAYTCRKVTIIISYNGLSPWRHRAITWTHADVLSIPTCGMHSSTGRTPLRLRKECWQLWILLAIVVQVPIQNVAWVLIPINFYQGHLALQQLVLIRLTQMIIIFKIQQNWVQWYTVIQVISRDYINSTLTICVRQIDLVII